MSINCVCTQDALSGVWGQENNTLSCLVTFLAFVHHHAYKWNVFIYLVSNLIILINEFSFSMFSSASSALLFWPCSIRSMSPVDAWSVLTLQKSCWQRQAFWNVVCRNLSLWGFFQQRRKQNKTTRYHGLAVSQRVSKPPRLYLFFLLINCWEAFSFPKQ